MTDKYHNEYLELCKRTNELKDSWLNIELSKYIDNVTYVLNDAIKFFRKLCCVTETTDDIEYFRDILKSYKLLVNELLYIYIDSNREIFSNIYDLSLLIFRLSALSYKEIAKKIRGNIKENRYRFNTNIEVLCNIDTCSIDIIYDINDTSIETFHKMLNNFKHSMLSLNDNLDMDIDILSFLNYQRLLENCYYNIITQCSNDWLIIHDIILEIIKNIKDYNIIINFNNIINFCKNFSDSSNEYYGIIFKNNILEDDIYICCKCLKKARDNFNIPNDIIYKILYDVLMVTTDLYEYYHENIVYSI